MQITSLSYLNLISTLLGGVLILSIPNAGIAQQADPAQLYASGMRYLDTGDVVGAIQDLRRAAELNHGMAQAKLAWVLDGAELNEEAVFWYQSAAEQQIAEGQYGLGTMLIKGEGVERDESEAFELMQKAAQQNHAPAMSSMTNIYAKGLLGQRQDTQAAKDWLQKGIDRSMNWAYEQMARAHETGDLGYPIDVEQAADYRAMINTTNDPN